MTAPSDRPKGATTRVLLAGVGYVGEALARQLPAYSLAGVRRNPDRGGPPGVALFGADLGEGLGLQALPPEVDQICIALSPGARTEEAYRCAYPNAVAHLATRYPKARLLLVSSTAVYGQQDGVEVDDDTPCEPTTATACLVRQAEEMVLAHGHGSCVLRSSGIYGPGRTRLVQKLVHESIDQADNEVWTNRIHRDDLARALAFLVERPQLKGTFLVTDLRPSTARELAIFLQGRNAARLLPPLAAPLDGGRSRRSRKMKPTRLLAAGFSHLYPTFVEGYGALLDELERLSTATHGEGSV